MVRVGWGHGALARYLVGLGFGLNILVLWFGLFMGLWSSGRTLFLGGSLNLEIKFNDI